MKIDFLLDEIDVLEDVSLNEVMGGISLGSYGGGCREQDHQKAGQTGSQGEAGLY